MFNIEKNIPMPTSRSKYPFDKMDVGDSILFENEPAATQAPPVLSARAYGKKEGVKFSARKDGTGVRVFRVA